MSSTIPKILPCPWCTSDNILFDGSGEYDHIPLEEIDPSEPAPMTTGWFECLDCGAISPYAKMRGLGGAFHKALRIWNKQIRRPVKIKLEVGE